MPKYNVMISRTRTIEDSVEVVVSGKDEAEARQKVEDRVAKAQSEGKMKRFNWEESSCDEGFEYEVEEA